MQLCEYAYGPGKSFKRNIYDTPECEAVFLEKHPVDSYRSIQSYSNGKPSDTDLNELKQTMGIYFDIDSPDTLKNNKSFKNTCSKTIQVANWLGYKLHIHPEWFRYYFSGAKGFHIIVPTWVLGEGFTDIPNLHITMKKIAQMAAQELTRNKLTLSEAYEKTGIDPSVYDYRRLFRLTNSINSKSGLYKIRVDYKEIKELSLKEIKELASKPRDEEEWLNELDHKIYENHNVRPYAEKLFAEANSVIIGADVSASTSAASCSSSKRIVSDYLKDGATITDNGIFLRTEALQKLHSMDDGYFRSQLSEPAPAHLTYKAACEWLRQNANLYMLTGLGKSCLCIYHDDHHPSAGILPPDAKYNYWRYHCFGSKDNSCLQHIKATIDLVADVQGVSVKEAVLFLCKIYGISITSNLHGNLKPLKQFISDNKRKFTKLSELKSGKVLKDLYPVYVELMKITANMAKTTGMDELCSEVYTPVSCRYLAKLMKSNETAICRKLSLLAALGIIKKVSDFDLPMTIVMKTAEFTEMCIEKYDGRTIQYYQVIDLLQTFDDGRNSLESFIRTQLKIWYASGYGISSVSYNTIEAVFGIYVAEMTYVKPAARFAGSKKKGSRLASLPI